MIDLIFVLGDAGFGQAFEQLLGVLSHLPSCKVGNVSAIGTAIFNSQCLNDRLLCSIILP
jgi:hypothetical protein